MTPQEIVKEINKLPPLQQKEVIDWLTEDLKKYSADDFKNEDNISESIEINEKSDVENVTQKCS